MHVYMWTDEYWFLEFYEKGQNTNKTETSLQKSD